MESWERGDVLAMAIIFLLHFSAVPRASFSSAKGQESKGKKSNSSLKTFYICMIFVGILGVAIALAMCIFQPLKRFV